MIENNKKYLVLTMALLIAFCLSACQATPEEPVVISKNDGQLEKKIVAPAVNKQLYEAPSTFNKTFITKNEMNMITIDAEVVIPRVNQFPVALVAPDDLTQEKANQIINTLMQGQQLYVPRQKTDLSKDEIIEKIAEIKSGKGSDLYELDPEKYKEWIKPQVEELEELLKTAPNESRRREADGTYQTPVISEIYKDVLAQMTEEEQKEYIKTKQEQRKNELFINVEADLGKTQYAKLQIIKQDIKRTRLSFQNVDVFPPSGKIIKALEKANVEMSVDEAKALANEMVQKMGLPNLKISASGILPNSNHPNNVNAETYEELPKCYVFYFTRIVNDVPVTYALNRYSVEGNLQQNATYSIPWADEYVEISVDDTGVLSVNYCSPTKVVKIINENVELKPFDEIMQRFEQQMSIGGAWNAWEDIESREITIDTITLGLAKIINKDNPQEYILVPAWDFFGQCVEKYKEGEGDPAYDQFIEDDFGHSYLTINAIDGSIIDRSLGY